MFIRFPALAALIVALLLGSATPAKADVFGHADGRNMGLPALTHVPLIATPRPVQQIFGTIFAAQRALNGELRAELDQARTSGSWHPAAIIMLISFLYGVLHAVGPGHGKFVVSGYFLTRRSRVAHGLAMSASAAFIQALSAIVWVTGLVILLRFSASRVLSDAGGLEMMSYGLIAILGLSMFWNVATQRDCCALVSEPGHGHHHHEHQETHDGHHHAPESRTAPQEWRRILGSGAAIGLRPCSGAILVLLFTLANAMFPIGILATLAMGLGVAITVSAVSLTSLGAQRWIPHLFAGIGGVGSRALTSRMIAYSGAMLVTAFGVVQFIGIWAGAINPAFGS